MQKAVICYLFMIFVASCNNDKHIDRPLDIEILQLIPDQFKRELDLKYFDSEWNCYRESMRYFKDGYELYIKLTVSAEIDEELSLVMSYFNHIISCPISFNSISNKEVAYTCDNEYWQYTQRCETPVHRDLKAGTHFMVLRFKFDDCVINDGYLGIKFPIQIRYSSSRVMNYDYIKSWERYPVYFSVKNGKISGSPIHYDPHVWPEEVYNYHKTITQ